MTINEKRKLKADLRAQAKALNAKVDAESRTMTDEENQAFEDLVKRVEALEKSIDRDEKLDDGEDTETEVDEPRSKPISFDRAPAVHTRKHTYNLCRALQKLDQGKVVDGYEGELSREIAIRTGNTPKGFFLPPNGDKEFRTGFDTTAGTGAIFTLPELPYIELLRNRLVCQKLGAKFLTDLTGKMAIPRQNAATTAYWVSENTAGTASNPTLDQVALTNNTVTANTTISRKLIYQSSVDAQKFVVDDMVQVMAIKLDQTALNGSGSGTEPYGILNNSSITTVTAAADSGNGGAVAYGDLVALETTVAAANADRGRCAYVTSAKGRGKLKQTLKTGSTFPVYCWENDASLEPGVGMVNGYPAHATNNIPANLTEGTGSGLTAIVFGNFEDLVMATWGAPDVILNPWLNSTTGAIVISILLEAAIVVRHNESFAKCVGMSE